MAIRITPDLSNTRSLMREVLTHLHADQRVLFLCDAGEGDAVVQRLRTMVSRVRRSLKEKKKPMKHFRIHHSVHPHTENGKRFDAVVMWRSRSESHLFSEMLEDLLS